MPIDSPNNNELRHKELVTQPYSLVVIHVIRSNPGCMFFETQKHVLSGAQPGYDHDEHFVKLKFL